MVEAASNGWIAGERGTILCDRVAVAYNKYQKCGPRAARHLFTTNN